MKALLMTGEGGFGNGVAIVLGGLAVAWGLFEACRSGWMLRIWRHLKERWFLYLIALSLITLAGAIVAPLIIYPPY